MGQPNGLRMFMNVLVAATLLLFTSAATLAYRPTDEQKAAAPDFDLRDAQGVRATAAPATLAARPLLPDQANALKALKSAAPDLTVKWSSLTGAPSRIYSTTQPLTGPDLAPARDIAVGFVMKNLPLLDLSPDDLGERRIAREFVTEHNGVTHLTIQQQVNGIDVFGGTLNINVDAKGRILSLAGEPIPGIHSGVNANNPLITSEEAGKAAAAAAGVVNASRRIDGGLVYFPMERGGARLAYDVTIEDAGSPNMYRTIVDAIDGTVLWRKNLTYYSHAPAHGPVYTRDSPNPDFPTGSSTGIVPRVDAPFNALPFFPHDDPHADWWNGSGLLRTTTISNNVSAQEDRNGDNAGGFRPTAGAGEDFTFPIDLTMDPNTYEAAAIANLFYWNNRLHDLYYRLGFDEAAGNFQTDNFGLGGSGGDPVQADAQDNRDDPNEPSLCNANFSTSTADGTSARMQMYQCTKTSPERDGDLDNHVIAHEYTHGVHIRLLPSLTGFQGGMSEGWSDWFGLAFLVEPNDNLDGRYEVGEWLFGYGIRRQPYSTDQTLFTRKYANIADDSGCSIAVCSNDPTTTCTKDSDCGTGNTCNSKACRFDYQCKPPQTSIDQGVCSPEVHNTGEIWAEVLWLARANFIRKYGWATGNEAIEKDVIDGMKLSPPGPDMLDERDAILHADMVNNGGVNKCLIWNAFARMGMGYSALTTGNNDINPVEGYDTPSYCTPNIQVSPSLNMGNVCPGDTGTGTLEISNAGTGELFVNSVAVVAGGSTAITVDPLPTVPAVVDASAHLDFAVRCAPTSFGVKTATIRIKSSDPDQPSIDVTATCTAPAAAIDTLMADSGNFGNVCVGSYKDLDLNIHNSGGCPLTVGNVTSSSADFQAAGTTSFPVSIGAGASLQVAIRFAPSSFGAKSGSITVSSDDPANPTRFVPVSGNAPSGTLSVTGSTEFGNVCAGANAEKTVNVCNVGACDLRVTGASFAPACADFYLDPNLPVFPITVSHDFCMGLTIRFTPTSAGPKSCSLVITTDDPAHLSQTLVVTANTPFPSIDVSPDMGFLPEVIQSVGTCTSALPFPISNKGKCNLNVNSLAVSTDSPEYLPSYSLSGVPSYPIILQPGHVAGEGALKAVFAPDPNAAINPIPLDRDVLGSLTVTYESDPITHDTTSVTRTMCGESVRTGARVLVRAAGVPLAIVEKIQLNRINANRNKTILDTADVARNVSLTTVTPAAPCAPFKYHREYGTVGNPIQLLPGSYQVTVNAIVRGKRVSKSVGFNVDTCDFNPTIVIDF